MATSEYLRNQGPQNRAQDGVSRLPPTARRRFWGPAPATSAGMVTNDLVMIVLAFALALVVRSMLVARVFPVLVTGPAYWASPMDLAYFGWFLLAYLLVARRYGLYGPQSAGGGGHELRVVLQGCLNAGLLLCGALYLFHAVEISRLLVLLLVVMSAVTLGVRRI